MPKGQYDRTKTRAQREAEKAAKKSEGKQLSSLQGKLLAADEPASTTKKTRAPYGSKKNEKKQRAPWGSKKATIKTVEVESQTNVGFIITMANLRVSLTSNAANLPLVRKVDELIEHELDAELVKAGLMKVRAPEQQAQKAETSKSITVSQKTAPVQGQVPAPILFNPVNPVPGNGPGQA